MADTTLVISPVNAAANRALARAQAPELEACAPAAHHVHPTYSASCGTPCLSTRGQLAVWLRARLLAVAVAHSPAKSPRCRKTCLPQVPAAARSRTARAGRSSRKERGPIGT